MWRIVWPVNVSFQEEFSLRPYLRAIQYVKAMGVKKFKFFQNKNSPTKYIYIYIWNNKNLIRSKHTYCKEKHRSLTVSSNKIGPKANV